MARSLLVLLALAACSLAARTPRPRPAPSAPGAPPAGAPMWNADGDENGGAGSGGMVNVTLSATMTPLASLGVVDDAEHMALCEDILARVQAEMLLRHADGQVPRAVAQAVRKARRCLRGCDRGFMQGTTLGRPAIALERGGR